MKGLRETQNAGLYPQIQPVVLKLLFFTARREVIRSRIYYSN